MPRANRYTQADASDALLPTWTTRAHDYEGQIEDMRKIRQLSHDIVAKHHERDELMAALALSQSLSRNDMARAAGLSKPRIDQIIREYMEEKQRRINRAAEEQIRRHMPPSLRGQLGAT